MDNGKNNVQGVIPFPCHSKEKVLVYEGTSGRCSIKCPSCDKFALFDFNSMTSMSVKAARGAIHDLTKQHNYKNYID